uniref:Uncharacterized protein n=1 Tax=Bionectria ochroleuca TaxID=29856 RepID=A0A8H7K3K4_BIOOC
MIGTKSGREGLSLLGLILHPQFCMGIISPSAFLHIQELELEFGPTRDFEQFSHIFQSFQLQRLHTITISSARGVKGALSELSLHHLLTIKNIHLFFVEISGGKESW